MAKQNITILPNPFSADPTHKAYELALSDTVKWLTEHNKLYEVAVIPEAYPFILAEDDYWALRQRIKQAILRNPKKIIWNMKPRILKKGMGTHLRGFPGRVGIIIRLNKWGTIVKWDNGKETRHDNQHLCECDDKSCSIGDNIIRYE